MSSRIKIFILPFVVSLMLFTGCKFIKENIVPHQPNMDRPFSCAFELTAFEDDRDSKMTVSGDMTRYGTGIWEMNITSPETMNGLNIKYSDGSTIASLGSLTLEIESGKLNDTAMFKRIFDAFDACAAMHNIELYNSDDSAVYNADSYSIAFDKETLLPTALTFSDGLTVSISSFCDLAEQTDETTSPTQQSDTPNE